ETSHQNCSSSVAALRQPLQVLSKYLAHDFYQWLLPVALCGVFSGLDPREQLPEKAQQSG
ncbi:hypothetical protein, partial [Escherichia coli]|uniref:hypothetical protein n=2 Tax=Enterobacteriaceae TaxID=543 RepID=UPI001B8BAD6C